jgi:hypothetical protein
VSTSILAEAVRFELTEPFGSSVFKTGAINRALPHFRYNLEHRAGFEPAALGICSPLHWATLPPMRHFWSGVQESNPHSRGRSSMSYPLNERQIQLGGPCWSRTNRHPIMSRML